MSRYILKRLTSIIPILIGASILVFLLVNLIPVDPAQVYLRLSGTPATPEAIESIRIELGLDKPLHVRYFIWLANALRLNFGISFVTRRPVLAEIFHFFPATLELTVFATSIMLIFSLPIGVCSAIYKDSIFDKIIRLLTFIAASIPVFWLGLLFIFFFSLRLGLFPAFGRGELEHVILPAVALALVQATTYIRLLRTSVLEILREPHVLYARARGLKSKTIIWKHVFKNAVHPALTALGVGFGNMMSGAVIVEVVFAWPGVGRHLLSSIFNRDYPIIQAYALLIALIFILSNLLVDIIYYSLDRRLLLMEGNK